MTTEEKKAEEEQDDGYVKSKDGGYDRKKQHAVGSKQSNDRAEEWIEQQMATKKWQRAPLKTMGHKLSAKQMVKNCETSPNYPGYVIVRSFREEACNFDPRIKGLIQPLAAWPFIEKLAQTTVPREKLLSAAELDNLSDEELENYERVVKSWRTIWFAQKFRHWHHGVRTSEIMGSKLHQDFYRVPPLSMPIRANVLTFKWKPFIDYHRRVANGSAFDVIITDPPWTLATEKSTRGVALNYDQITDKILLDAVPFADLLNDNGVVFMWVINAKLCWAIDFFLDKLKMQVVECISWMKMSTNRLQARGHGFYLQHAKEDCIVAVKGDIDIYNWHVLTQNYVTEKRGQSQKPDSFYDLVEAFMPTTDCKKLEVFARRNNLRSDWVGVGNQL